MTCVPDGDVVPAGTYGGVHYQLIVAADGTAELLGDCSRATASDVSLDAGLAHWTLQWQGGYGLPVQDTATIEYTEVVLDGTYCGGELNGTLTFSDGETAAIDVMLDRDAEIYACM